MKNKKCLTIGFASAAVICMFMVCTLSYCSINVQANSGFKYFTSVTVEQGETFGALQTDILITTTTLIKMHIFQKWRTLTI